MLWECLHRQSVSTFHDTQNNNYMACTKFFLVYSGICDTHELTNAELNRKKMIPMCLCHFIGCCRQNVEMKNSLSFHFVCWKMFVFVECQPQKYTKSEWRIFGCIWASRIRRCFCYLKVSLSNSNVKGEALQNYCYASATTVRQIANSARNKSINSVRIILFLVTVIRLNELRVVSALRGVQRLLVWQK